MDLSDMKMICSKKIGTKWFSLAEHNIYKTSKGDFVKILMLGDSRCNWTYSIKTCDKVEILVFLEGAEIDEATEKALKEEGILI